MAKDKKSFLLYCDLIHTIEKLTDKEAGEMFKHILRYVNDQDPITETPLIDVLFEQIKQQLKRDLKKYENICERNKINGSKGGRPAKPKKPSGLSGNPKKPKKADTDTDTDTDNFLRKNTVWRNDVLKHFNIELEEYLRHLTPFELQANMNRSEHELKKHFFNFLNNRDLIKKKKQPLRNWDDVARKLGKK